MADGAREREFRILSLAGGGYLGLYTACVLAELEARAGEPLARRFDLIAGTSVGGILAIALAFEFPMARMRALFEQRGRRIFSARALPSSAATRMLDLARAVTGPKYGGRALREALAEHLGERTLAQARHRIVIPAVDVTRSCTKVFKTPHARASLGDGALRALDVAMATSAAPAFFPAVEIGPSLYADGGLFAVAPDLVALHEAEHFLGADPADVSMLSIGTATRGYRPDAAPRARDGALRWLSDGRLLLTLIALQQQHVEAMMRDRLGARYVRLDAAWTGRQGLGLDVATRAASAALTASAAATIAALEPDFMKRVLPARTRRPRRVHWQ